MLSVLILSGCEADGLHFLDHDTIDVLRLIFTQLSFWIDYEKKQTSNSGQSYVWCQIQIAS